MEPVDWIRREDANKKESRRSGIFKQVAMVLVYSQSDLS
jgi:hypothetical protein